MGILGHTVAFRLLVRMLYLPLSYRRLFTSKALCAKYPPDKTLSMRDSLNVFPLIVDTCSSEVSVGRRGAKSGQ